MTKAVIYVALLNEAVDVWRPVGAEHVHGRLYRIVEQPSDPESEQWQFNRGDTVECDVVDLADGPTLVAVRRIDGSDAPRDPAAG